MMLPSSTVEIFMTFILGVIFGGFGNDLHCPHPSQRKFRILSECNNNSSIYNCLFDTEQIAYYEFCKANRVARAGLKLVITGSFRNVKCSDGRYQPFTFESNQSSDCSYLKSKCTETGQIISDLASTITDSNCRCDYRRNFSFIFPPRNSCFCIPSEEDCSCYIKQCPNNSILSPDYECVSLESTYISFNCTPATDWPTDRLDSYQRYQDHNIDRNKNRKTNRPGRNALTVMLLFVTLLAVSGALLTLTNVDIGKLVNNIGYYAPKKDILQFNINKPGAFNGNRPENYPDTINDTKTPYVKNLDEQILDKKRESNQTELFGQQKRNQSNKHSSVIAVDSAGKLISLVDLNICQASPNIDNEDFSFFMDACKKGNLKTVKYCIRKGQDVNITNSEGQTPFYQSCVVGTMDLVNLLIEGGCDVNIADKEGITPFMESCRNGHISVVECLIAKHVDIHIVDKRGNSALHWSCYSGKDDVVKLLLNCDCDPNKQNIDGRTSFAWACYGGRVSTVRLLIDRPVNINNTDTEKKNVDINSTDKKERTALYWSCSVGAIDVLKELIKEGCDIEKPNKTGETPLMAACCKGHVFVVKELIKAGVDIHITDEEGNTSLHWSCFGGNIEIVNELIKKGLDIDKPNKFGTTPLMAACRNEQILIVKLLITKGANTNIRDEGGYTALHSCCLNGQIDMVTILVGTNNTTNTDSNDPTPLQCAIDGGNSDVVELLLPPMTS